MPVLLTNKFEIITNAVSGVNGGNISSSTWKFSMKYKSYGFCNKLKKVIRNLKIEFNFSVILTGFNGHSSNILPYLEMSLNVLRNQGFSLLSCKKRQTFAILLTTAIISSLATKFIVVWSWKTENILFFCANFCLNIPNKLNLTQGLSIASNIRSWTLIVVALLRKEIFADASIRLLSLCIVMSLKTISKFLYSKRINNYEFIVF